MVSCLMGDSTALASAIVRCCPNTKAREISVENTIRFILYPPKYNKFHAVFK